MIDAQGDQRLAIAIEHEFVQHGAEAALFGDREDFVEAVGRQTGVREARKRLRAFQPARAQIDLRLQADDERARGDGVADRLGDLRFAPEHVGQARAVVEMGPAPCLLRLALGDVGGREQVRPRVRVLREIGAAAGDRDRRQIGRLAGKAVDPLPDRLEQRGAHRHEGSARVDQGEFVAAEARGEAVLRLECREHAADRLQHFVADAVAERVVDVLEQVDIQQGQGERAAVLDAIVEPRQEAKPIGQTGETVGFRHAGGDPPRPVQCGDGALLPFDRLVAFDLHPQHLDELARRRHAHARRHAQQDRDARAQHVPGHRLDDEESCEGSDCEPGQGCAKDARREAGRVRHDQHAAGGDHGQDQPETVERCRERPCRHRPGEADEVEHTLDLAQRAAVHFVALQARGQAAYAVADRLVDQHVQEAEAQDEDRLEEKAGDRHGQEDELRHPCVRGFAFHEHAQGVFVNAAVRARLGLDGAQREMGPDQRQHPAFLERGSQN